MRTLLLVLLSCAPAAGQIRSSEPLTVPERTDWARTSTLSEVEAFLSLLDELPTGDRLHRTSLGTSHEGRSLPMVIAADPPVEEAVARSAGSRLRVLVNANIHGGEVEGKEVVQILLRELAQGRHAGLLEHAVLVFVPVYNADGNERIDRKNRFSQNGPDAGVGERANAQGLDLNRDFIKVESPECAALLEVVTAFDPHLFMDLHTTNGSAHGYHLTYSPSLSTNADDELDRYTREELLPVVRSRLLEEHGFRVFDYGNFTGRNQRQWITYDHRPRFGTNYMGLRNRIAVLSEAFSYLDFRERIEATHAFVLEVLEVAVADRERVRTLCAEADRRVEEGDSSFRHGTSLAEGFMADVLVGEVRSVEVEGIGTRRVAEPTWGVERMRVRDRFSSTESFDLPAGWILLEPTELTRKCVLRHGLWVVEVLESTELLVQAFAPSEVRKASRPFQGHLEIGLSGDWREELVSVPAGSWFVSSRQPLGRLAAQLFEPESEDSLSTWNYFEEATRAPGEKDGPSYPVLRLIGDEPVRVRRVPARGTPGF